MASALAINILLIFAFIICWFISLIDVARSDFQRNNKTTWILLLIFLAPIGTLLYMIIGRKQKIKKEKKRLYPEERDTIYEEVISSSDTKQR